MEDFLEKTGTDIWKYLAGAGKLLSYTMGRDVITRADIEAVCTTQITNRIFEMIRAVTEKKQRKALDLYQDLLALKEPPMRDSLSAGTPVQSAAAGQRAAGRALRSGDDRKTDGTAELRCAELYSHVAPVCGGGIKSGGQ